MGGVTVRGIALHMSRASFAEFACDVKSGAGLDNPESAPPDRSDRLGRPSDRDLTGIFENSGCICKLRLEGPAAVSLSSASMGACCSIGVLSLLILSGRASTTCAAVESLALEVPDSFPSSSLPEVERLTCESTVSAGPR